MSIRPVFTIKLGQRVLPRTVSIGLLDGVHPSLVAATDKAKVFVHTPHTKALGGRAVQSDASADVSLLNINQSVRCVAVGKLRPDAPNKDILVIGTATHVLAYDVDDNRDLFHREVPDGVNTIAIGQLGRVKQPLAVCGGSCAIQGFDASGNDPFWTVTGDNVTALCLCDIDGDGENELIVGSEDFDIRVFKNDEIISETSETEAISHLCWLSGKRYAYTLANGTLGVYEGLQRLWRIKSKNQVMAIHLYDIDGDGELELVVGWSNGKIDFRSVETGEVLIRESMNTTIAGITEADYRLDGHRQLICVSEDGELRGFLPANDGGVFFQPDPSQEILHEFALRKQNLIMELNNYEQSKQRSGSPTTAAGAVSATSAAEIGAIPANTHLQTTLYVNAGSESDLPCVELYVKTSNETVIRAVMVFAEGIFNNESHVVLVTAAPNVCCQNCSHPNLAGVSQECRIELRPEKDVGVDLHVKCLVGFPNSVQYHVFELSRTLPRFSMYALCNDNAPQPSSFVTFVVNERPQRVAIWINENFLLQEEIACDKDDMLDARFFSLRGSGMLFLQMDSRGRVHIRCDDMELCGNLVSALAEYLSVTHLESQAEFPVEIERIQTLVGKVNEIYVVRDQLSGDVADLSNLVRGLIVRAEDARIIQDMPNTKRYYTQLYNLNQELISQYKVRCNNHDELLNSLKHVNQIIQKAGKLRDVSVGKPKTAVIAACREAIKDGNTDALPKIIRLGAS